MGLYLGSSRTLTESLIPVYTQKQHKPPAQLKSYLNLSNTSLKWNLPGIYLDSMILVGSFQLRIFHDFQDILCHTCIRLPAQEDQIIITTPKAFVGLLAGWGGKLWYSHQARQENLPGNSWDTELGDNRASQIWTGREGTFLQHSQPETPSGQLQEHPALPCCQGTPQQSQIPWRVPAGNHSCPCSGSHSLARNWLYPKSPCSMTCTWRFWSPYTWNFSRLEHPVLAEGVGLDDV